MIELLKENISHIEWGVVILLNLIWLLKRKSVNVELDIESKRFLAVLVQHEDGWLNAKALSRVMDIPEEKLEVILEDIARYAKIKAIPSKKSEKLMKHIKNMPEAELGKLTRVLEKRKSELKTRGIH